jgi:hypothetical protein
VCVEKRFLGWVEKDYEFLGRLGRGWAVYVEKSFGFLGWGSKGSKITLKHTEIKYTPPP